MASRGSGVWVLGVALCAAAAGGAAGWFTRGTVHRAPSARTSGGPPWSAPGPGKRTPGPCLGLVDGDGSASLDGRWDSQWRLFYDDQRRLLRVDTDYGQDGKVDARATHLRDEKGQATAERYDCDADGEHEETITYARDRSGRARLGMVARVPGHAGVCLSEAQRRGLDRRSSWSQRQDWGAFHKRLGLSGHAPAHGVAVVRYSHAAGRKVLEEWDMNGDGWVDELIHFVHDAHGNLLWEYHDDGPDGTMDVLVRYDHSCWGGPRETAR